MLLTRHISALLYSYVIYYNNVNVRCDSLQSFTAASDHQKHVRIRTKETDADRVCDTLLALS